MNCAVVDKSHDRKVEIDAMSCFSPQDFAPLRFGSRCNALKSRQVVLITMYFAS